MIGREVEIEVREVNDLDQEARRGGGRQEGPAVRWVDDGDGGDGSGGNGGGEGGGEGGGDDGGDGGVPSFLLLPLLLIC